MRPRLLTEPPRGRFTFVVGKGGTGKSTTAAALALNWAEQGDAVHLISTDPAPSIYDIFGIARTNDVRGVSPCNERLTIEELDAENITSSWMEEVRASLEELIEKGTYLDSDDVAKLSHLTLPGIDELGAALRLTQLAGDRAHVVVDTAPTGHTLRLLDAADLIDSWARVFTTMADKVATVALMMVNARVRLRGEDATAALQRTAASFRDLLRESSFVIVSRSGDVVEAETRRLNDALRARGLNVVALVEVRDADEQRNVCDVGAPIIHIPRLADARGCEGLRAWKGAAQQDEVLIAPRSNQAAAAPSSQRDAASRARAASHTSGASATSGTSASSEVASWIQSLPQKLLWFAGKGGTGKSTCAAATALTLSMSRRVLLCSTDPAGSLREVLQMSSSPDGGEVVPGMRVLQVDAAAQLNDWRERYRAEAEAVFEELGVGGSATLDRAVMNAIWDAVPPGIDELFALSQIVDAAETGETIVVDAAPTGHFLRLIESPEIALDWTHAILRILLKYGVAGKLEGFSERVLAFARQLKQLRAMLIDAQECGVLVVSLDEPVVAAQTARLVTSLGSAHIAVLATIINRIPETNGAMNIATSTDSAHRTILAPNRNTPPAGPRHLSAFIAEWRTT